MRQTPALLLAFGSPAAAWLKYPFVNSRAEESWTPPRETSPAEHEAQLYQDWSPRPTEAPKPLFGRMGLLPRADGYDLAPGTCGFVASNENAYVCIESRATCTLTEDHVGCCIPNQDCNVVKTTCIDYDGVADGQCDLPDDFSTLCCNISTRGGCYTYLFSTSDEGDDELSTYSFLDCSARPGTATLLDYDPAWSRTYIPSTTTEESSTESESETSTGDSSTGDSSPTETGDGQSGGGGGGGDSGPNVGAIAGGAVGGVAALGLVGLAAFLLMRRRKKNGKNTTPVSQGSPPQAMSQHNPQSPPPVTQSPSSPGPVYPSGAPSSGYGAYSPQQGYDPHMSTYSQQSYPPPQQGYQPFPAQGAQGQYPGPYPPQQGLHPQQAGYGYQPSSTGSPPPTLSPSPPSQSPGAGYAAYQHPQQQPQQPATELQSINPVGNANNRAELG